MAYVWAFEHSRVPVAPYDLSVARGSVNAYASDGGAVSLEAALKSESFGADD
jgi:hypothetical protein